MPTTLQLKSMSRLDKLRTMEALWADLSQDDAQLDSPAWHGEALRAAERAVATGTAKFSSWEESKKRLHRISGSGGCAIADKTLRRFWPN
jgi:hypothetical protein